MARAERSGAGAFLREPPGGQRGEARRSGCLSALPRRRGARTSPGSPAQGGGSPAAQRPCERGCTDRSADRCADWRTDPSVRVESVRIATWNVNSAKQWVPRRLPRLDERRPDVVCLQETKLADDAFTAVLALAPSWPTVAMRSRRTGEPAWNGVAILSRAGLEDVVAGLPWWLRLPAPGGARGLGPRAAGSGSPRCTSPTGASPIPSTTATSSPGWPRCAHVVAAGPEATVVCGEHERGSGRRRRASIPDALHRAGPTPATAARARGAGRTAEGRPAGDVGMRDRWPDERVFTYWGAHPGGHVSQGPREKNGSSPRPREHAGNVARSACGRPGSTATPARAAGPAITPR